MNPSLNYGIVKLANHVFDYLAITFIGMVSLLLVVPFFPIYIGIIGYFLTNQEDRELKTIFRVIKTNARLLIPYSLLLLLIGALSALNLLYALKHPSLIGKISLPIHVIALGFGFILFINGPAIIYYMQVSFKQLLFNSIVLFFHRLYDSFALFFMFGAYGFLSLKSPLVFLFGFYFVNMIIARLSQKNIMSLRR